MARTMQNTNHLLMIRPVNFKFNEQTAGNNKFQQETAEQDTQEKALKEFDGLVTLLRAHEVDVTVIDDTLTPETPDSIFPNNWLSFHHDGQVFLYPMFSENRRLERRDDILTTLEKDFKLDKVTDLSIYEAEGVYLEGTGSMVLDRDQKIAYACLSVRTDQRILQDFCAKAAYTAMSFNATDASGFPIYHTNVMMCIGDRFVVICLESICNETEKQKVLDSFTKSGKEVVTISLDQMNHFAGNMLQVNTKTGAPLLIMSEQAYLSLQQSQITTLEKYSRLVYAPLYTIEQNGGGSARCMLAEIYLEKK
jgi:hypothetical protein